jgi:hypothetical protein
MIEDLPTKFRLALKVDMQLANEISSIFDVPAFMF